MTYIAPLDDIFFALKTTGGLDSMLAQDLYPGLDEGTIRAVIEEAGKFASDVLDPINASGDRAGSKLINGKVVTPPGFAAAYKRFADGGWSALPCPEVYGGQGLPEIISVVACEIWNSANMAFGMCPLLTQGAIHAIETGGSDALKDAYLPKMISGQWTGTMNLTEPHAGSDLSQLTTKAECQSDGSYRITGTKIYISYGDHDMAENIIHLVLARLPDGPPGTRGISLFLVPKILVHADGTLGAPNDVICAGVEHKLGITASPTCVMKFGEQGGATGYLVGDEHRGLATMFVMMNAARLAVGMQGVAIAERATQRAVAYAKDRRQGRSSAAKGAGMSPIIEHPDMRRTLLSMKALTQAARMICLATARELDLAHRSPSVEQRRAALNRAGLLTPIAKAVATDTAVDVASMGVQVHGGMGFVEDTGAAQHLRDARILPIYEGTNGIQAIDLVMRKVPLEGGAVVRAYLKDLTDTVAELRAAKSASWGNTALHLGAAIAALGAATDWILAAAPSNPDAVLAGASPYLKLFGLVCGAHYLARGALTDGGSPSHTALARYFAENGLSVSAGLAQMVVDGADTILSADAEGLLA